MIVDWPEKYVVEVEEKKEIGKPFIKTFGSDDWSIDFSWTNKAKKRKLVFFYDSEFSYFLLFVSASSSSSQYNYTKKKKMKKTTQRENENKKKTKHGWK